jgi:thiamine kinase-like enzyme
VIEQINPKIFGVENSKVDSIKKLGSGEENINFLLVIGGKKFVCRVRMQPREFEREFKTLKAVEKLNITPKVYFLFKGDKNFNKAFMILEYIEGKAFAKKKRTYQKGDIISLAKLLAKMHNSHAKLPRDNSLGFDKWEIKEYIKRINKYRKKDPEFTDLFDELLSNVNELNVKKDFSLGIIHRDICPQNMIKTRRGIKLIDWGDLSLSDPAKDIAHVIIELKYEKNLKIFFREYFKHKKDHGILERAEIYIKSIYAVWLVFEIVRTFEIINKELPKEYLQKTSAKSHIREVKRNFRNCIKLGIISRKWKNLNLERLFRI